jgi:hypothetical protein
MSTSDILCNINNQQRPAVTNILGQRWNRSWTLGWELCGADCKAGTLNMIWASSGCWCMLTSSQYVGWHKVILYALSSDKALSGMHNLTLPTKWSIFPYSTENLLPMTENPLHCVKTNKTHLPDLDSDYQDEFSRRKFILNLRLLIFIWQMVFVVFNWVTRQDSCAQLILDFNALAGINT